MLWVYCHGEYFYSYSAGIDFRRLNLTSMDNRFRREVAPRAVRVNGPILFKMLEAFYFHFQKANTFFINLNPLHADHHYSRFEPISLVD